MREAVNLDVAVHLEVAVNMEEAEERRASLMQEILEEDLGEMEIRLIALEKKVDKLHPGGFLIAKLCNFSPQLLEAGVPGNMWVRLSLKNLR